VDNAAGSNPTAATMQVINTGRNCVSEVRHIAAARP
jgi:hypothetical protein